MAGSRLALCNEKIDLHSRCGVGFRRAGIKVQFMPAGYKHLREDILHEHPFVSDAAKLRRGRDFNMLLKSFPMLDHKQPYHVRCLTPLLLFMGSV